jgi:hypothetical protein
MLNSAAVTDFFLKSLGLAKRILLWIISAALIVFSCQEKLLASFSIAMIVIIVGGAIIITYFAINNKLVKKYRTETAQI